MTKPAKAKPMSDALEAIHSAANGLRRAGVISKVTLREYDAMCLKPTPEFDAKDIRRIREVRTSVNRSLLDT
jgi:putative transcriptional regulator